MGITFLTNRLPGTPFLCTSLLCPPQHERHQLSSASDHPALDSHEECAASDPGTRSSQQGSLSCEYLMRLSAGGRGSGSNTQPWEVALNTGEASLAPLPFPSCWVARFLNWPRTNSGLWPRAWGPVQ